MTTDLRRCWRCRNTLPVTAFSHNWTGTDLTHKRRYCCRTCNTVLRDEWRANLTDDQRDEQRAKQRARQARSQFTLAQRHRREDGIATMVLMIDRMMSWGLSQSEIARRSGLSPNTIFQWRQRQDRRCIKSETVNKVMTAYLAVVNERREAA